MIIKGNRFVHLGKIADIYFEWLLIRLAVEIVCPAQNYRF
jgi:hypothetical protein